MSGINWDNWHDALVRTRQVEMKALEIIEAVRRGEKVEDDLIECKSDWPALSKARQLAGLCNKARGSDVLLIIGLDEQTGVVHALPSTDPATWWASFQARFDEVAPDLTNHLRVAVGDGEFVTALTFDTSRVPFVVKTLDGSASIEREIPIRDGTRTRSAYRREILQLLAPTLALPAMSLLDASATVTWQAEVAKVVDGSRVQPECAWLSGHLNAYVEHLVSDLAMIPTHLIEARASFGDFALPLKVGIDQPPEVDAKHRGVDHRRDGVRITGPGIIRIAFDADIPLDRLAQADGGDECNITADFNVSSGARPIRVIASCRRQSSNSWPSGHNVTFSSKVT